MLCFVRGNYNTTSHDAECVGLHSRYNGQRDLRIRFLTNEIDEVSFKESLQKREKHRKKAHAIHQVD